MNALTPDAAGGRRTDATTATDVLETFDAFQSKSARTVADSLGIDREEAERLLDRLVAAGELTKVRGGTEAPVWLRPFPADSD